MGSPDDLALFVGRADARRLVEVWCCKSPYATVKWAFGVQHEYNGSGEYSRIGARA
jgi:hypothetical protein